MTPSAPGTTGPAERAAWQRLAAFAVGLLVLLTAGYGVGLLAGPFATPAGHPAGEMAGHGSDELAGHGADPASDVGGLQVEQGGYRLVPQTTGLTVGTATPLAFRIVDGHGAALTRYTATHTRDLHLIVVRRDLTGFQHLHPELGADGTWRTTVTVAEAGQYRLVAQFQPAGRDATLALGVDLPAAGGYQPQPLPEPVGTVRTDDGYQVTLDHAPGTGVGSTVTVRISRGGAPVTDLEPYLGAGGHLVAFRAADLAYLHVHPHPFDTAHGPQLSFDLVLPGAGSYRLFLEFAHRGTVHTAAFTVTV